MSQKTISVGDTSRAFCAVCNDVVPTTAALRDVPFSDGSGTVSDLLVGVCDHCDAVVSIPAQSIAQIKAAREALV